MEVDRPARATIRFGAFELDIRAGELQKEGVRIKLQEQPLQILCVLLENPGEVVTREEIQQRLWPSDTFVDFEHGLYNAIKRVREALGDSAENPRFIETVPKRGYRFIGSVTAPNGNSDAAKKTILNEITPESRRLPWPAVIALIAVVSAVMALLAFTGFKMRDRGPGGTPVTRIQSLAVLPLTNLSGDPAQDYFSEGVTDGLITDLAQIGSLRVISRTSSMQYNQTHKSLPEIARDLKVDGIIEGTVQRSGDRVRITVQLVRAASDEHIWANSYERDVRDVLGLERDLTAEIAREVQARLTTTTASQMRVARAKPVDPKVLEAYLQGNYHLNRFSRGSGDEELRKAGQYFHQAIDADPGFAPAYVAMCNAHWGSMQPTDEDLAIARKAAETAVKLDPGLSDGWVALAVIKWDSWDWSGAEEGLRRAITLNPNNASAHDELGWLLDDMGRLDAGLTESQIAQQLDPNADHISYALFIRGQYDRAIEVLLMMLRNDPNSGYIHHQLYEVYATQGRYKEAIQHLERVTTLFGFPKLAADLHRTFTASGYTGAMRLYAKELEHLYATHQVYLPVNLAAVYVSLGDKDRAFYWLEEAYKHEGQLGTGAGVAIKDLKIYPPLAPLRTDPRFKNLVRRMGLPE